MNVKLILAGLAVAFAMTTTASAGVIVFDDADGSGWSRPHWTPTQTDYVMAGTTALGTGNGQIIVNHAGFTPASGDEVYTFYINTSDGGALTNMMVIVNGSERKTDVYVIDGVSNGGGYFAVDADAGTWQKVEWDSSTWAAANPGTPITTVQVSRHWSGTGNTMAIVADNLSFGEIPEPATMGLVSLGGLALVRRRRR